VRSLQRADFPLQTTIASDELNLDVLTLTAFPSFLVSFVAGQHQNTVGTTAEKISSASTSPLQRIYNPKACRLAVCCKRLCRSEEIGSATAVFKKTPKGYKLHSEMVSHNKAFLPKNELA